MFTRLGCTAELPWRGINAAGTHGHMGRWIFEGFIVHGEKESTKNAVFDQPFEGFGGKLSFLFCPALVLLRFVASFCAMLSDVCVGESGSSACGEF